jgi:hypothetical protein
MLNYTFYMSLTIFWASVLGPPVWEPGPNFLGGLLVLPKRPANASTGYIFGGVGGDALSYEKRIRMGPFLLLTIQKETNWILQNRQIYAQRPTRSQGR